MSNKNLKMGANLTDDGKHCKGRSYVSNDHLGIKITEDGNSTTGRELMLHVDRIAHPCGCKTFAQLNNKASSSLTSKISIFLLSISILANIYHEDVEIELLN